MRNYKILAHRGASAYAPENTIPAFKLAIEKHTDGFELDINFTKDKEIVVLHDDSIDRTSNGKGDVSQYTLNELKKFNFNKGFEEKYPVAPIPTLNEVLELVREHNLILNIEVKDIFTKRSQYSDLGMTAAKMVRKCDLVDNVIFSSFNHYSMVKLKEAFPEMKTALLYFENLYKAEQYALMAKADALHPLFMSVNEQMVKAAHAANIQVNPYTVNDPEMMKMFKEMEVDSIITDYPDVCYEVRCSENAGTNEEGKIMDLRVQGIFGSIADYLGNDDNLKQ